jgi:two-component system NarL family response regulator
MQFTKKTNVLVIHEDPILAMGLSAILGAESNINVSIKEDFSISGFICPPSTDVVIADYDTGVGLAALYRGQTHIPESAPRIMIVTSFDREWHVCSALNLGVHGYVLQCCRRDELLLAIRKLDNGANYVCQMMSQMAISSLSRESLTPREHGVLNLLANGACNRTIARALGITIHTTKAHVKSILEKLDAVSRTEAAVIAMKRGLVATHGEHLHQ